MKYQNSPTPNKSVQLGHITAVCFVLKEPSKTHTTTECLLTLVLGKNMEISEIHYRTGLVVEQCNQIEQYLNAIIEAYVLPKDDRQKFFRSHVLHSSIMPFSAKVKLVTAINRELKLVELKRDPLHRIMQLRNAFAHNDLISGIRMDLLKQDTDPEAITVGLESISGSGELMYITRDAAFHEFQNIHQSVESVLKKMLGVLRA